MLKKLRKEAETIGFDLFQCLECPKKIFSISAFSRLLFIKSSGFSLISDIFKDRIKKIFANTSKAVFAGWMYSQSKRSPKKDMRILVFWHFFIRSCMVQKLGPVL